MKSSSLITGSLRLSSSRWQRNTTYKNSNVLEGDLISGSLQWRYRCHNSPTSSWRRRLFCNKKSWSTHDYHQHDHHINGHDHHYHDHHPQHNSPVDVGGRKGLKPGGSPGKEKPGKPCSTSVTNHHDHHHHPGYTAVGPPVGRPQDQGRGRCLALLPKSVEAMSPLLSVWNTCDTFWISLSTKSIIPAIKRTIDLIHWLI